MKLIKFVEELEAQNVKLFVDGEQLRCRAPKEVLTPDLLSKIKQYKSDIITLLRDGVNDSIETYPLSQGQRALWFLYQLAPESAAYNINYVARLRPDLELQALQQAFDKLVERHAILRTTYTTRDGEPVQQFHKAQPIHFKVTEADNWSQEDLTQWLDEEADRPFNLEQGPVFRIELLLGFSEPAVPILSLTIHHIVTDFLSLEILIKELESLYQAIKSETPISLPPLKWSYKDYVRWETEMLASPRGKQLWAYWQKKLGGELPVLNLPTDHHRPPVQTYNGTTASFDFDESINQQILEFSKATGNTPYVFMLAVFQTLLRRYTGQEDILIGTPMSGRHTTELQKLTGYFVNPVILRHQLHGTFEELLKMVRQQVVEALDHQEYPFGLLVEQLQPIRDPSRSPLYQVAFVWYKERHQETSSGKQLVTDLIASEQRGAAFDLSLTFFELTGSLRGEWTYNTDLFEESTINRLTGHLKTLVAGALAHPQKCLSKLPLLTDAEQQQLLAWNDTATDYPLDKTIVDLFEEQVEKTPDNIAVVFENQSLTYRQLNEKANQLAHYLLSLKMDNGSLITDNSLIAIAVERSLEMVIGLLGILKMGGAYVPIDPSYPPARIRYLLDDSATPLLLTVSHLKAQLSLDELESDCVVVCLDEVDLANRPFVNPSVSRKADDLAYVIYTSGSTGKPKGVMVEYKGLVNLALTQISIFRISSKSRVLQFASFSFDASVSEIKTTLLTGATLYLVPKARLLDSAYLTTLMVQQQISHITLPPSFLSNLSDQALSGLKTLVVAGEACPAEWVKQWANKVRFINAYGPTESTVCASVALCFSEMDTVGIGQPIANTRIYILDAQLRPLPPGIPGELCIAGTGLARGYLNRPELTKEKFIQVELFGKTERIYKTGDLARWLPDGNLEYLGRIDHQIKLRGFRIELGEIEAVINQHPAVKEAVVTLFESDDNKRLVAYLTTDSKSNDLVDSLKKRLKASLPDYMMPSHFTVLERLPLTHNGKIDRKALPAPEFNLTSVYELPRNDIEQQLAQIWSRLLKQNNISIHDNFFSLGGDSILSIQIVAHARQAGLQLTPRDLFEHQTVAELATAVRFGVETDAEQGLVTGEVPLTPIQHWFFARDLPKHFNQSIWLRVPADFNVDALRQALATVLSHHDALRLRYQLVNGNWQQSFANPKVSLSIEDISEEPALSQLTLDYQRSLNITDGPLMRMVFFKLRDSARLFWCIHHLVVDGVSWRILQEDLYTAYTQTVAGQSIHLPPKTSSFKAWAERLKRYAASEVLSSEAAYWQALPTFSLPADNQAGKNRLEYYQDYTITLNRLETEALLKQVPTAYNTRINDVLLTALALALAEWTGKSHCLIDLEGHGRAALFDDIDLSRTVGWFTTIHPIALTLPSSSDLGAALKAIKEQLRAIPNEGIGYGLLTQSGLPKGEILFNYLGQFDPETDFEFATTARDVSLKGQRDHLIDINGAITQGQLSLNWSYSGDCYKTQTIETLAESYKIHLQQLITHCQTGQQGVTPSDFPLATVTQSRLDALYKKYSGLIDLYPLTPMQQGMLFHTLYETGIYFEQMQLTLSNLEPAAFKAAWQHQLERHPILRSAFLTEPFLQVVQAQVPLHWREHDWRDKPQKTQQEQLNHLLQQEREQGFDLSQAPLMRFDLIHLDKQRYAFIQHHHHILTDGWCLPIIFSEVRDSYLAFKQGQTPKLPRRRPYRDYIAWLQQQDSVATQQYWQQRLTGFTAPTTIPIINHKTETPLYHKASYGLDVKRLQDFQKAQRVTLNTIVQGAWALLLSRYSGESDLCFGVTVSGRHAPLSGIEQMIGLFINTLPLRLELNPDISVTDYLLSIQSQHQDDNRYAHSPLFDIQNQSSVPNGTPLFESLLVFENYPLGDALEQPAGCYQIEDFAAIEYTNYPLTLAIVPGESLSFIMTYDSHRISHESIERLWGHLNTLLMAIVENPAQSINQLPMLTEKEIQQLQGWNETATDYPLDKTIVDLFVEQVSKTPENVAVVYEETQLTYQALNAKANQLGQLLRDKGIGKYVPVLMTRSLEVPIAFLAIMKSGAAFVPIDIHWPENRIEKILSQLNSPVILVNQRFPSRLSAQEIIFVKSSEPIKDLVANLDNPPNVQDPIYVIYTSGSTGEPKGAINQHRGIVNRFWYMNQTYGCLETDVILQTTPHHFDSVVWQLFWPLINGAKTVIPSENIGFEPILELIAREKVTITDFVPAILDNLVEELSRSNVPLPCLRQLLIGGEAINPKTVSQFQSYMPNVNITNAYGPTDTAIGVIFYEVENPDTIPIGKPIANVKALILDKDLNLLPIGVPGELYIGGVCVGLGYLNNPAETKARFINNPFAASDRLYKTGDLARWLPDGNIEYLGRLDHQVKLRGFRIELGEIEACLRQDEAVTDAVVTLFESDDNKRLVAYLTTNGESNELVDSLKKRLKASLPDYMIPTHFTVLEQLPLTPNGKIDRKALPAPEFIFTEAYEAPRNEIEQQLAKIWSRLLKQNNISIHDNFFELGGDSILSLQMTAKARHAGLQLTPRDLFEHQTVAELATAVRFGVETDAEQGLVTGEVPLTPIQHLFLAKDLPEYWHFNQSILLQVPADLKQEALRQALAAVISHHDALRLRYRRVGNHWQQSFATLDKTLPFSIEDLSESEDPITELSQLTRDYQRSLNITDGPLTRMVFFKLRDSARLFWCIHHLVVDGVSWRILQEDLHSAYLQCEAGQAIQLPAKTSSFKAWAQRLLNYAQSDVLASELADWQALPSFSLPVDNPGGHNDFEHYQDYTITLTRQETEALLKQVPAAYNTRINDVLLTALALALADWTGGRRCLIDLEGHGRVALFEDIDLSRTVGWFTTIHPLTLTLPSSSDLGAALKAVKEQLRAIVHEGIGYGLLSQQGFDVLPKGEILFNYLGQFDQGIEAGLFRLANEATSSDVSLKGVRSHLIDINGAITQGELSLNWSYSGDCYSQKTIETLALAYQKYLTALIQHCQEDSENPPNLDTLLPLRLNNEAQRALFCLPGLGSKAGYFLPLAKTLDTTLSVYGLESPSLDGQIPETVEALAQYHLDIIRATQPNGPYYLIGHSFGAVVALEMAWYLEQAGETLGLLAIFDQPTPQYSPENEAHKQKTEFEWLWNIVLTFKLLADIKPPFSLDDLKKTNRLNYAYHTVMNWLRQENAHDILFSKGLPEELRALVKVYRANALAFSGYQQDRRLRCPIDLFCAVESINTWGEPDGWGWREHTLNGVRIHQVTGSHFSMLNAPQVQILADKLTNILKRR
jgi:amino acid adenylation domain-containing protein/non-ribosomal peptide synthase protein (TIGR01720 family)